MCIVVQDAVVDEMVAIDVVCKYLLIFRFLDQELISYRYSDSSCSCCC